MPAPALSREVIDAWVTALRARPATGPISAAAQLVADLIAEQGDSAPEVVLGAAYQRALSGPARRRQGSHFTPRDLVRRVIDATLDSADLPTEPTALRALDPAMGAGAFLCEALRAIVQRYQLADTIAVRRQIARSCLYGIDKDPLAVHAARRALWLTVGDAALPSDAFDHTLVCADALLEPRERWAAFHAVVGNPPYLGGKRIRTEHGDAYAARLLARYPGVNKNCDLAGHFLRQSFDFLAAGGALGLVVTNSIAQGDTRAGGLAHVLGAGGVITRAERRVAWPGSAGVVTSLIWIRRGSAKSPAILDGAEVPAIDAWLSAANRRAEPARLETMRGRAFIGCFLRGAGFVIGGSPSSRTSPSELDAVLASRPTSARCVKPFLGGREVVTHPEHAAGRRVIDFSEISLEQARAHPELCAIVERDVRPVREAKRSTAADAHHARRWWQFANTRPRLTRAISSCAHVIVIPRVAAHVLAVRVPTGPVFSDQLVVVPSESFATLALLSSRVHAVWAHALASSLGDGLRYTPSDVFETFPLPSLSFEDLERDEPLALAGRAFHDARRAALLHLRIGLTELCAGLRKSELDPALEPVRCAWLALDQAVLGAYGWADLDAPWHVDERGRFSFEPHSCRELIARLFALNDRLARQRAPRASQ